MLPHHPHRGQQRRKRRQPQKKRWREKHQAQKLGLNQHWMLFMQKKKHKEASSTSTSSNANCSLQPAKPPHEGGNRPPYLHDRESNNKKIPKRKSFSTITKAYNSAKEQVARETHHISAHLAKIPRRLKLLLTPTWPRWNRTTLRTAASDHSGGAPPTSEGSSGVTDDVDDEEQENIHSRVLPINKERNQFIQAAFRNGPLESQSCAIAVDEWLRVNPTVTAEELSAFFRHLGALTQFTNHRERNTISHVCYDEFGRTPLKPTDGALVGPRLAAMRNVRSRKTSAKYGASKSDADQTQSTRLSTASELPSRAPP
jgi:hypothetical protein